MAANGPTPKRAVPPQPTAQPDDREVLAQVLEQGSGALAQALQADRAYELRVKNQGTAASINVRLTANLPEQLEFVSADGDSRVVNEGQQLQFAPIPELPPGDAARAGSRRA